MRWRLQVGAVVAVVSWGAIAGWLGCSSVLGIPDNVTRSTDSGSGGESEGAVLADGGAVDGMDARRGDSTAPGVHDSEGPDAGAPDSAMPDSAALQAPEAACPWVPPEGGVALFGFDDAGSESDWISGVLPAPVMTASDAGVARSAIEGHSCPGALMFSVPFLMNDGKAALVQHVLGDTPDAGAQDWRGRSMLHYWVKLQTPAGDPVTYLQVVQPFVQSGDPSRPNGWDNFYASQGVYRPDMTLSDAQWHEIAIDLTVGLPPPAGGEGVNLIDVNTIGVQLDNSSGPASFASNRAVLYVDDIWLE